jgi:hypothetical protein
MTFALCLAVLAASPGLEDAQRLLIAHAAHFAEAKVGDWVTYRFSSAERGAQYFRLAVVDTATDRFGRDAFWIEIEVGEHPALEAPLAQIRILAAKETGLRPEGVTRVIAAVGAEAPAELPADRLLPTASPPTRARPASGDRVRAGRERALTTGAGTLLARPIEVFHGPTLLQRWWVSRRIPLLHLARLELLPIGHSAEVWDYGSDAHSRMVLLPPNELSIAPRHAQESP